MSKPQYQRFQLADKIEEVCVRTSNKLASNAEPLFYVGLQDIQDVFPNASRFKLDGHPVPFLIDSAGKRIEPWRIEFYPDKTLEVVLSDIVKRGHVDSTLSTRNSEFENKVFHELSGLHNQSEKILEGVQETNNRLTLVQSKVEAMLTQNYELLEYTNPRLFIVLPETATSWDPATMFQTKFRLHFICECGEHTKTSGGKIPHLHLSNHEGYVVNKPTQFFKKYGSYLMTMLEMIKLGTGAAAHVVPTKATFDTVPSEIIEGVDYSLKYLEEGRSLLQTSGSTDGEGDVNALLAGIEGLEGMELQQLGSYLESNNSENLLGNLYRMITKNGLVKWVCCNHYRVGYQEIHTQKLHDVVNLARGVFDEQLGSIKVNLVSSYRAAEFYDAINKAKAGVYDLDITLDWDCTKADLGAFEKALKMSSVSFLRLDIQRFQSSIVSDFLSTSTRYEILARIIEHVNMKTIHVVLSKDFMKLSNLIPKRVSHLHKLSLELIPGRIEASDFQILVNSLKTNTTLTHLDLRHNKIGNEGALALLEALKTNTTLTTLNLSDNSIGEGGALALSIALMINTTLTTLDLRNNTIGNEGALALSDALKANTTLTNLNLSSNLIGNKGAQALSEALQINTTLTTLDLERNEIRFIGILVMLKLRTTKTTVDFSSNLIGKEGALALSEVLKTNTTFTTLILRFSSIGKEGALVMSAALKTNTTLTTLDLSDNLIGDEGVLALSELLKTNTTLTTLDLYSNSIKKEGALALSDALKINNTLTTLTLSNNWIGDEGALALSEALKTNTTLTSLEMYSNQIGKEGALALSEALKINTTLTALNIEYNRIGMEGALALSEVWRTDTLNLRYHR
ncbi:hypothetical protein BGZ76_010812 [Entomortierella beljakovae]|nr:hypothetical protein BGZ76_010812 [Entomortierella beljakovae]